MRRQKGFTLIELLVVIAIIGLLATIAVVALNSARQSSRDSKRIADVRQVQTALEMYYNAYTKYPYCGSLKQFKYVDDCADGGLFKTTYIAGLDNVTDPQGSATTCQGQESGCDYGYFTLVTPAEYRLYFFTEGTSGSLNSGKHTASPAGIQ